MLQLVQSPSQRIQRLIEKNCNKDGSKVSRTPDDNKHNAVISTTLNKDKSNIRNEEDDEDQEGGKKSDELRKQLDGADQKRSESRLDEISSVVSVTSSDGRDGGDVARVRKVVDRDGNLILASTSYSSSSTSQNQDEEFDEDSDKSDDYI